MFQNFIIFKVRNFQSVPGKFLNGREIFSVKAMVCIDPLIYVASFVEIGPLKYVNQLSATNCKHVCIYFTNFLLILKTRPFYHEGR